MTRDGGKKWKVYLVSRVLRVSGAINSLVSPSQSPRCLLQLDFGFRPSHCWWYSRDPCGSVWDTSWPFMSRVGKPTPSYGPSSGGKQEALMGFPTSWDEMRVSVLHCSSCELQPIATGGTYMEEETSFKLCGVYISNDLIWAAHSDYVMKKANRRFYAIRHLKKSCVPQGDLVSIYCCCLVRSIVEYAGVVFATRFGEDSETRLSDYIPLYSLCESTYQGGWYSHPRGA